MAEMNTSELRLLAENIILIENESQKWAAGIPDSQEGEAEQHSIRLSTAIRAFRDATRSPSALLELLDRLDYETEMKQYTMGQLHDAVEERNFYKDRLDAAEKVCEAAVQYFADCASVPDPEDMSRGGRNKEWVDAALKANESARTIELNLQEWQEAGR